jgi:NMD protein affecting ribosome stability and mRNA decay
MIMSPTRLESKKECAGKRVYQFTWWIKVPKKKEEKMVLSTAELRNKNDCADKDQQQFALPNMTQPRTKAIKHKIFWENPHCYKLQTSKKYVRIWLTTKTQSML